MANLLSSLRKTKLCRTRVVHLIIHHSEFECSWAVVAVNHRVQSEFIDIVSCTARAVYRDGFKRINCGLGAILEFVFWCGEWMSLSTIRADVFFSFVGSVVFVLVVDFFNDWFSVSFVFDVAVGTVRSLHESAATCAVSSGLLEMCFVAFSI